MKRESFLVFVAVIAIAVAQRGAQTFMPYSRTRGSINIVGNRALNVHEGFVHSVDLGRSGLETGGSINIVNNTATNNLRGTRIQEPE